MKKTSKSPKKYTTMTFKSSKTYRYVTKLCQYVELFINAWNNELEYTDDLYLAARKADLIAYILGLKSKGLDRISSCDWSRISYTKQRDKKSIEAYIKNGQTPYPSRLECLEDFKKQAFAIKEPIEDVEVGPMSKLKSEKDDIEEALNLISEMLKIYEVTDLTPDLNAKGLMLNKLAIKMGLMSKYREKAAGLCLVLRSSKRQPYNDTITYSSFSTDSLDYPETESKQKTLIHWKTKLEKLHEQFIQNNKETEIPIEFQTIPLSLKFVASCIGGDMNPRKLRSLMDSNFYNHIKVNRESFVFDLRKFPPHIQKKLLE